MNQKQEKILNIAKQYAISKGGECVSEKHLNAKKNGMEM